MAAMMTHVMPAVTTTATDESIIDKSPMEVVSSATSSSSLSFNKWTGQNSYTQQLLLPNTEPPLTTTATIDTVDTADEDHYSSAYSTNNNGNDGIIVNAYQSQWALYTQSLTGEEDGSMSMPATTFTSSNTNGSIDEDDDNNNNDDPYEMQFTNYLKSLQNEEEELVSTEETVVKSNEITVSTPQCIDNNDSNRIIGRQQQHQQQQLQTITSIKNIDESLHREISSALQCAQADLTNDEGIAQSRAAVLQREADEAQIKFRQAEEEAYRLRRELAGVEEAAEDVASNDGEGIAGEYAGEEEEALASMYAAYHAALAAAEENAALLSSRVALLEEENVECRNRIVFLEGMLRKAEASLDLARRGRR